MKSECGPHCDAERDHIKSFPKVDSHYCCVSTNREHLGSHFTVLKMYGLYKEKCINDNIEPVNKSKCYNIFSTKFNDFTFRKKMLKKLRLYLKNWEKTLKDIKFF